ncbi:Rieske 2Fe-2S domain-containing protein [Streptomyces sp. NPDC004009]
MTRQGPGRALAMLDRLERWPGADGVIEAVQRAVRSLPLGAARDALHGRWLGHPVHPLLVQVPIGTWLSASLLDALPGVRRGQRALTFTGLVVAVPAAVTGWADWAELHRPQQRVGVVHALANSAALALFTGSLVARVRGRETAGKALGIAGLSLTGLGGALGGHMAYRQAAGANHAEYVAHAVSPGWHRVGELAEFPHGQAVRRHVDDVPVMVVRESEDVVHVLADRCSHMAGPLSQGDLVDGCVRCPWHGSVFRLADGWNVRGPATAPQPSFDTRVTDGAVEVRLRG